MSKSSKIKSVKAREILNSRGNPTVEAVVSTSLGDFVASVPAGASKGEHEAVELRDGGERHKGKGVLNAVKNVNEVIAPKLAGKDPAGQLKVDKALLKLDGTENKSRLGANAMLAVSIAVCRAGAAGSGLPLWKWIMKLAGSRKAALPEPSLNIINGGAHANNKLDFQEFMIVPQVKPFSKAVRSAEDIYHQLRILINERLGPLSTAVGDEGGFAPQIKKPEEALDLILEAAEKAGYKNKVKFILDVASSEFFVKNEYKTRFGKFNSDKLLAYYLELVDKYPIIGIEDGFAEDEWESWSKLKEAMEKKDVMVIGDDLTVTNPKRVKEAVKKKAVSAMIVKPNQIGTVSEAIECASLAKKSGLKTIVSHRSGETLDDFIADFSVGINSEYIKSGMPARKERKAKYDRLINIEKEVKK